VTVPVPETIREPYLEVRDLRSNEQVVTVLEVLSPTNKRQGAGRETYLAKREEILKTRANLVEVDLLRGGEKLPELRAEPGDYDCSILVCRAATRPTSHLFMFNVRDPIEVFRLPLRAGEEEPAVDLRRSLTTCTTVAASTCGSTTASLPSRRSQRKTSCGRTEYFG
jgi:hypothetical protein